MAVCLVCLNCKVKLSVKRKIPCVFFKLFFATVGRKNFVHLGFGNWKMGTDIPSHSPVAGSEEGNWERDEPGSYLWESRANKHLFCILLASFVPLTSSLPVPRILLWHPFIQSYFMCFRLISRVEMHFTESTNCSSPKANTSWPA